MTAIHDVFHAEHNRVLQDLKAMVLGGTDSHGNTFTARADAAQWTGEMFFQAAKLVTEMEYQHLVFGEFVRKLSPNINAFAAYDATIDPAVTAEFAHAVYRFGHSMLTDTVNLTGFDPATGLANGTDKSMGLIQAFLNPTAYSSTTAGEFAIGGSQAVGNAIDPWVTDALRNNLVGLPLDLATLNIVRGRDAGIMTLNQVRADLYAKGVSHLAPYTSWDEFAAGLAHPEALENFIMAYSRDATLNGGLGNDTLSGGTGNDVFVFNTAPGATNVDTITDFSPNVNGNNDTIWLAGSVFTGLGATNATLNAAAFRQVTTATLGQVDATDRIIYNSTTGALSWDADGSGANFQAVQFAQLNPNLNLTNQDFRVI